MYEIFDEREAWEGLSAGELETEEAPEVDPTGEGEVVDQLFAPKFPVPDDYPDLEVTYSMFGDEKGFDQVYEQAGDWLEMPGGFFEQYSIFPVNISS